MTVLCIAVSARLLWVTRGSDFVLERFDILYKPVKRYLDTPAAALGRLIPRASIALLSLLIAFLLIDAYVLPDINHDRIERGEEPLLILASGFFWDGGTRFEEGVTYGIRDSRRNTLAQEAGLESSVEQGLHTVYFIDLPFRDERIFAERIGANEIRFSDK